MPHSCGAPKRSRRVGVGVGIAIYLCVGICFGFEIGEVGWMSKLESVAISGSRCCFLAF